MRQQQHLYSQDCLCFACFGIRRAITELAFAGFRQNFNNTVPDPYVHLSTVEEILNKKEQEKVERELQKFNNLMNKLYQG